MQSQSEQAVPTLSVFPSLIKTLGGSKPATNIEAIKAQQRTKRHLHTRLNDQDLSKLKEFRSSQDEKHMKNLDAFPERTRKLFRQLFFPTSPTNDVNTPFNLSRKDSNLTLQRAVVSDDERVLYENFVKFSGGASAFGDPKKGPQKDVIRIGDDVKLQIPKQKDGARAVMHLHECLEFCKSVDIVPVVHVYKDAKGPPSVKTDITSLEYATVVEFLKSLSETEDGIRPLDFKSFKTFLYKLLTYGPNTLTSKLQKRAEDHITLQKKIAKYLPSTDDPVGKLKEFFEEIFDTVYDAFVFFDIDGSWHISTPTFLHVCKNALFVRLTTADLKIALSNLGLQQSIDAHQFVHSFAWHPIVEKPKMKSVMKSVPPTEIQLYRTFISFCGSNIRRKDLNIGQHTQDEGTTSNAALGELEPELVQNDHITFQGFVRFLKFVKVVPTCIVAQSMTGGSVEKTDVGSLEYDIAVQAFRQTIQREDLMEWMEFKDCLFNTIRGGARKLKHEAHVAKNELYSLRMKLSNFAPSVSNPFLSLKLALRTRFDSVFDAFVYFDIDGSWTVSTSEFKSMVKALGLSLTSNDVDAALREICILGSNSFNAMDFCSKLNWADFAPKETQHFNISELEEDLYETFCQFCKGKESHSKSSHHHADHNAPGTRGFLLTLGEFLEFCKFTDLMPVEFDQRDDSGVERTKVNRQSIQYAIAVKVFNSVNWTNEKEHEVSWPEFKEVIFQYFKSGPTIAKEILAETEEELQSKYSQFCDNIVSVADPVIALKSVLSTRFNNVFDAFAYMDLNGDWEVSANEMTLAFNDLQLGLTRADLFAVIRRIMKRRTVDAALVISPHEFVKALAWHPRPSQGGIQSALEEAKQRRETTAEEAERNAQQNPFPKPKPSFQRFRTEDAEEYKRLEGFVEELKKFISELEKSMAFRNIPLELLAMSPEEKEHRKHVAKQRLRERSAQSNEKTTLQLLEESRNRRPAILAAAARRARENREAPQRFVGEPPPVETLLLYASKRDKESLRRQVHKVTKIEAAVKKLSSMHEVLGVKIKDLPMSAKQRYAREEVVRANREARKKAVLGDVKLAGQVIEEAKRNRSTIFEKAHARASRLRRASSELTISSPAVEQIAQWFDKRALHLVCSRQQGTFNSPSSAPPAREATPVMDDDVGKTSTDLSTAVPRQGITSAAELPRNSAVVSGAELEGKKIGSAVAITPGPIVLPPLPPDVLRFARNRDFQRMQALSVEMHRLRFAVEHLLQIRSRGVCSLPVDALWPGWTRLQAKLAVIAPDVIATAARTLQRCCRASIITRV